MDDPLFERVYNESLLADLEDQFGPFERHQANISASSETMLRLIDKMQTKPRRGEVVMVVPNEQGQIWLHTKDFYPQGVYRLMTGGLEMDERPEEAMVREVEEETGFKTKIDRCLAVITYTVSSETDTVPFVSYTFLSRPTRGQPQLTDSGEAITAFRAVPVEALPDVAAELRALKGEFEDWGVFRAIAHEVAWRQLTTQAQGGKSS